MSFSELTLLSLALLGGSTETHAHGFAQDAGVVEAVQTKADGAVDLVDGPLADYQEALLVLAYRTASKMPLEPHIKNRSRAQERVIVTCLELDQPKRALAYAEGVANWRKGAGIADVACYAAEHGITDLVPAMLERAEAEAVRAANQPSAQEWRPARIRSKIARAWAILGDFERASQVEAGVEEASEVGLVESVRVTRLEDAQFDEKMAQLLEMVEANEFETMKLAMRSFETMHELFYADEEKRARIEKAADESFTKMPPDLRIGTWMRMGENAIEQADPDHAVELLDRARSVLDSFGFAPKHHVPLLARLAGLRHRAGQEERALSMLQGALAMFEAALPQIQDFRRTEVLLPVAEAHAVRRDQEQAVALYERCLTELSRNPNARVRTDDLVEVCCSMAKGEVAPGNEFLAQLQAAGEGMKDPW